MDTRRLRIALLGGVPASLGGGGLELQIRRTADALHRRGCEVFHVGAELQPREFDVLHAFSAEPDVAHLIHHWRRNRNVPLVLTPVIVVEPGLRERTLRISHHMPLPAYGPHERALLLAQADVVVALTEHERTLIGKLARGVERVEVIGNGVDQVGEPAPGAVEALGLPEHYVVLLGSVSPRKRQADVLRALAGTGVTPVVVGALDGTMTERAEWEELVDRTSSVWLGEVSDPAVVRAVLAGSVALVHLSAAEGQSLAVLEALAAGCPAIVSDLPSHVELRAAHPQLIHIVEGPGAVSVALGDLPALKEESARVDSWDDVAGRLVAIYQELIEAQ